MADSDGIVISSLGEVTDISAGDLLLISQVQSDGTFLSKKIDANIIKNRYVLFSGSTRLVDDATITLSDNISNYKSVEVFYAWNNWVIQSSKSLVNSSTVTVVLHIFYGASSDTNLYMPTTMIQITGTTLKEDTNRFKNVALNNGASFVIQSTTNSSTDNHFTILQVIGYK